MGGESKSMGYMSSGEGRLSVETERAVGRVCFMHRAGKVESCFRGGLAALSPGQVWQSCWDGARREGSAWPRLYRSWSVGPGERGGTVASLWAVEELVALM